MKIFAIALLLAATLSGAPLTVRVRLSGDGKVAELPIERYVAGVLAAESPDFRSDEALKAMAVVARTYAVRMRGRHGAEGFDLCDTTHCQRMALTSVTPRIEAAVRATAGEMVWYQGKPAFTPFSRDCGGITEDAAAVWPDMAAPYLRSHADEWCVRDAHWHWNASADQVVKALSGSGLRVPRDLKRVTILDQTGSRRATTLLLIGTSESDRITASSFRFAIGRELGWNTLPGDLYSVRMADARFLFDGTGSGHGVGLCQHGAEAMGLAAHSYHEILANYFPGTTVGVNGAELQWRSLKGETISLFTTRPAEDRAVLTMAERLAQSISARTGWPVPRGIEIRVYPDLDTFRNATAEPGWVAAHTAGTRIDLQPLRVLQSHGALESTLKHELIHAMMEPIEAPDLPLWFQEGVTAYLEQLPSQESAVIPAESDLRQTADATRARRAYGQAEAMVASLARRYGEAAVLDWARRGVPAEVTKASDSHPSSKSR